MTWAPFSTFGWSLSSPHNATSSPPGCHSLPPEPALPASPPTTGGGGGFPRAHVTPLAIGSQGSCQRLLCWTALSCQELQGFLRPPVVSSQQLWGRLCNGWVLKIEKTKVCIYFHQIITAKGGKGGGGRSCDRRPWIVSRD